MSNDRMPRLRPLNPGNPVLRSQSMGSSSVAFHNSVCCRRRVSRRQCVTALIEAAHVLVQTFIFQSRLLSPNPSHERFERGAEAGAINEGAPESKGTRPPERTRCLLHG